MSYFKALNAYSEVLEIEAYDYFDVDHLRAVELIMAVAEDATEVKITGYLNSSTIVILEDSGFTVSENFYNDFTMIYWNS